MTIYLDEIPLADDVPVADAAEQHQPATSASRTPDWIPATWPT